MALESADYPTNDGTGQERAAAYLATPVRTEPESRSGPLWRSMSALRIRSAAQEDALAICKSLDRLGPISIRQHGLHCFHQSAGPSAVPRDHGGLTGQRRGQRAEPAAAVS